MSTTLLPFLYQTRTLQLLSRAGVSTPALKRFQGNYRGWRQNKMPKPRRCQKNEFNPEVERIGGESIPFELPEGYERPPPREISHLLTEEGDRTTITPAEKEAFKSIFEELEKKRVQSKIPEDVFKIGTAPTQESSSSPTTTKSDLPIHTAEPREPPEGGSVEDKINIIIQDAAEVHYKSKRHVKRPYEDGHPLGQTIQAKEWNKALLRFPPSLRSAARRALGVIEESKESEESVLFSTPADFFQSETQQRLSAEIDLALNPLAKSVEHESLRRAEQKRIEEQMQAVKTDFELWDVLEKEVFPLVERLGLTKSEKKRGRKTKAEAGAEAEAVEHRGKLPIHIYGPVFPRLLLTALRMMDQNFAHTSPLALNILPRIKETGHAGYVLGASTAFYNALARIEWYRYGNPENVFNLFEEMRHAGLLCDIESKAIQESIENWFWVTREDAQKRHPFLKEIVSLPEWEFTLLPRIQHWATTITLQMQEQRYSVRP